MGKRLILPVILFALIQPFKMSAFDLRKVIDFGSDEDRNYIFFKCGPIAVDKEGNIFIADPERCVIRKYDKDGLYIKETGEKGQGPEAFMGISGLVVWRDSLLIYDSINKRLSQYNFNLEHIQSARLLNAFSTRMACNRDYLLFNRWQERKGGIMMVRPFTDWKTLIIPNHDFGKYKKHRLSPLFNAFFHYVFSVNPETGGFVTALRCPLSGRPQLIFFSRDGAFERSIKMDEIAEYEFDERFVDVEQMRKTSRKDWSALNFSGVFFLNSRHVLIEYAFSENISDPDTVETGLLLINTKNGKIKGKVMDPKFEVRCVHNGLAYGYIRDAEDAELKVGVYRIVL